MAQPAIQPESLNVLEATSRLMVALTDVQIEASNLALKLAKSPPDGAKVAERSWRRLRERRAALEAGFTRLAEAIEDWADIVEADRALEEPGESVPWESVTAKLDRS